MKTPTALFKIVECFQHCCPILLNMSWWHQLFTRMYWPMMNFAPLWYIYNSSQSQLCLPSYTWWHLFSVWHSKHRKHSKSESKTWTYSNLLTRWRYMLTSNQTANKFHCVINEGIHTRLCLELYIARWDRIKRSSTCVWTRVRLDTTWFFTKHSLTSEFTSHDFYGEYVYQ